MTTAQHTPGPWTYKATAGNHDFIVYPEATGRDVALVRDFNEANARLIAEAPAMRDYLAAFIGAIDRKGYEDRTLTEMADEARALLARVDGSAERHDTEVEGGWIVKHTPGKG